MKFELIKKQEGLEMYDDIPCLPLDVTDEIGERFIGEESDSWLLLDEFVNKIDGICPNMLDYGDVDYFDRNKCVVLKKWLEENKDSNNPRLKELFEVLYRFVSQAIELNTGVVIGL